MLTATNPLLCNLTVTLLWKCNELIVTQQELLRYYSDATKDLTCHNSNSEIALITNKVEEKRQKIVDISD
jgi:hypothetical protein